METISVNALDKEISRMMSEYCGDVTKAADGCAKEAASACRKTLNSVSPKRKGAYASGWGVRKTATRMGTTYTVYNGKHYRLTHLLEHGHDVKVKKGGPVVGHAREIPHIAPAAEKAAEMFHVKLVAALSSEVGFR